MSTSLHRAGADPQVLVVITHSHVRLGGRLAFALASFRLLRSLTGQDGLICFAAGLPRFAAEAWTVTAWRDEAAVRNFHHSALHRAAMREGASGLQDVEVVRLRCHRDDVPLRWRTVRALLLEQRRRATGAGVRTATP